MMKLKRIALRTMVAMVLLYIFVFVFINYIRLLQYVKCDMYTKVMNGGVHTIQGQSYNIELCGLRGRIDPSNVHSDEVRLRVFSMDGQLLVVRYYQPILGMPGLMMLEYRSDSIVYFIADDEEDYKISITMPPSAFDRLLARLPRLWP